MYASHIKRLEKSIRSEPQSCTRSTLGEKEEEERRWHSASRTHDRIQRCGRRLSIRGPMRVQVLTEKVKQAQPPHAMHEIVACFVAGEKSFGISSECSLAVAQGRGNLTSHHPPGTGTRNRRTGGDASCRQQAAHGAPPARMRIASPLAAPSMGAPAILPVARHSAADHPVIWWSTYIDHKEATIDQLYVHKFCIPTENSSKNSFPVCWNWYMMHHQRIEPMERNCQGRTSTNRTNRYWKSN